MNSENIELINKIYKYYKEYNTFPSLSENTETNKLYEFLKKCRNCENYHNEMKIERKELKNIFGDLWKIKNREFNHKKLAHEVKKLYKNHGRFPVFSKLEERKLYSFLSSCKRNILNDKRYYYGKKYLNDYLGDLWKI